MDELIRNIRTDLRLAMNGVISSSMREKGINYKMNFGVDVPKLRSIADKYEPNVELAEKMWTLDVREMKILSIMLYPIEHFTMSDANRWVKEIPTQEMREHLCRNLLQELEYSDKLVEEWVTDEDVEVRITGYWLFVRLMLKDTQKINLSVLQRVAARASSDVVSEVILLSRAALNALKHVIRRDEKLGREIISQLSELKDSTNAIHSEIFNDLLFEFEHALNS